MAVKNNNWLLMGMVIGLICVFSGQSFGQMIRLQAQAAVEPKQDVRLGDIAVVSGTDSGTAEELSNIVILSGIEGSRKIRADSVLMALMSQRGGKNAGGIQISGAAECAINIGEKSPAAAMSAESIAMTSSKVAANSERSIVTVSGSSAPVGPASAPAASTKEGGTTTQTLAKQIVERIQHDLGLPANDVRVTFETISPMLDHPVPANRSWLCRPLTRALLGTVQFEAQLVEGPKIIERLNVQTKVERRQRVVVTTTRLDRGDIVSAEQVHVEDSWLDRNMPTLMLSDKDVVGLEAQRSIDVGSALDQRDLRPAMMAVKNDSITVIYKAGSLQVQMRGRALADGKLHDQVLVRNESTGDRYLAVMIGKGLAVVGGTLTEAEEKKLRGAQ